MPTTRGEARALPSVGSVRRVVRRSGEKLVAEVVEVDSGPPARFYVHYTAHDRRMDEWIGLEQFDEIECEPARKRSKRHVHKMRDAKNDDHSLAERLEAAREKMTRVKNVPALVFSDWEVETWYWSPFPEKYHGSKLYVCDFTLRYAARKCDVVEHARTYDGPRHPPGARVYEGSDGISLWEVRGKDQRLYCQNLCLIAKLFLDHKTLYYDVDPFVFYVLTENGGNGERVLGYFSKERASPDDYNLACILTFPQYQRRGFGTLLISLSYELTKLERKQGSPEKPLSDLGKLSYRSYWTWTLLTKLRDLHKQYQRYQLHHQHHHRPRREKRHRAAASANGASTAGGGSGGGGGTAISGGITQPPACPIITVDELGRTSGIKNEDIISTLHHLNMLRYWKGQAVIRVQQDEIETLVSAIKRPPRLCEPENITWHPEPTPDNNALPPAAL
ncbi:hypothetical protein CTAYLR_004155 [Chrysophaeum taylorii]|uniref:Histone acetyltransferase n=1 Tax=Chrysophaeum taylorii TaxID=2483200 RepID=A0AAD7UL97_9STRA|nr:hypothetical protein CTAYLR_004155 [Chrysophaeum taylorii]